MSRAALWHALSLPQSKHPGLAVPIVVGVGLGVLARAMLLRVDERPLPTHPHGRINYLFLGLVAAVLGALAPAALLTADYTAGVFLALGTAQFHTVRQVERDMLLSMDASALVPRGRPYVEHLAMMLETRNYLALLTAMAATTVALLFGVLPGAAAGMACGLVVTGVARGGPVVGDLARVELVEVQADGAEVMVGGTAVRARVPRPALGELPQAVGVRLVPRGPTARLTLAEPGERQAILHNLAAHLGTRRLALPGVGGPPEPAAEENRAPAEGALLPAEAVDPEDGAVAVLLFPQIRDADLVRLAAAGTPLLETVVRAPRRRP